jgi:predicted ATPase/DNA-binding NarL/FixJ family response regulator
LDSFVGRAEDLVMLGRLLRSHRLVTVLGPAGIGKTRLTLELAGKVRKSFPDGVHLIEFGPANRPELAVQAVATALAVGERPGVELLDTVCAAVGERTLLVVLDNCEHLLDACAEVVAALLGRCPRVRVLATSRELMRLPGEVAVTAPELQMADAVRLFVERAAAVAPDFAAWAEHTPIIERICQRLDRVPLAIELAARLMHSLPPLEILRRLDDRLTLLTMGSRVATGRHRDLRSAIAWSYDLLEPSEQRVLRRLSTLPGGFDLDTAAEVCADPELPAAVPELVSRLAAKSLVTPVAGRAGLARFRQLESIRLYAAERLAADGESERATGQVVAWLTGLVAPIDEDFMVPSGFDDRLAIEHDNLLAAVDLPTAHADERRLLLVTALVRCWIRRGQAGDGERRLTGAIQAAGPVTRYRGVALEKASWLASWRGDHDSALRLAHEATELARRAGRPAALARALTALGFAHQQRGDYAEAVTAFNSCLAEIRSLGQPLWTAMCLNNLANAYLLVNQPERATELLDEALPIYREHAEPIRLATMLHTVGTVALVRDRLEEAQERFIEVLEQIQDRPQHVKVLSMTVEGLGVIAIRDGRIERGLRLLAAADAVRTAADLTADESWWRAWVRAAEESANQQLPQRRIQQVLAQGQRLSVPETISYALHDVWVAGRDHNNGPAVLSGREQDVTALVTLGLTNRQIAARLGISERTVEAHLDHIRTKLDLRSRAQIAAWCATNPHLSKRAHDMTTTARPAT